MISLLVLLVRRMVVTSGEVWPSHEQCLCEKYHIYTDTHDMIRNRAIVQVMPAVSASIAIFRVAVITANA